ncbi:hypothetical protein LINPERPRIM_LOCUS10958 [Linum perenne]
MGQSTQSCKKSQEMY